MYWISSLTLSYLICSFGTILDFGTHCPVLLMPWFFVSSLLIPLEPSPSLGMVDALIIPFPFSFYFPKITVPCSTISFLPHSLSLRRGEGTILIDLSETSPICTIIVDPSSCVPKPPASFQVGEPIFSLSFYFSPRKNPLKKEQNIFLLNQWKWITWFI